MWDRKDERQREKVNGRKKDQHERQESRTRNKWNVRTEGGKVKLRKIA